MTHHEGVEHVGLPRVADLPFVILPRKAEGLLECTEIVLGPVLPNLGLELAVKLVHRIG